MDALWQGGAVIGQRLSQCELMHKYVSCVGVHVPQYLSLDVI